MIADLHCDLLLFLAHPEGRSAHDPRARCSLPQLKEGGVCFQTFAIYAETIPGSSKEGLRQMDAFSRMVKIHPQEVHPFFSSQSIQRDKIACALAIENASSLVEEDEPLSCLFSRLEGLQKLADVLYLSLTWNTENRFGGGALVPHGLKPDGEEVLRYLHEKQIAIDLSHTSDNLAADIFNFIDKNNLTIDVIASHSNFRAISPVPRNLSDEFAVEIAKRGGVIGINFYRQFVGMESSSLFADHIRHALKTISEDHLVFGADFFYDNDLPESHRKPANELYFPEACHAGIAYDYFLRLVKEELSLPEKTVQKIASKNLINWAHRKKINNARTLP